MDYRDDSGTSGHVRDLGEKELLKIFYSSQNAMHESVGVKIPVCSFYAQPAQFIRSQVTRGKVEYRFVMYLLP